MTMTEGEVRKRMEPGEGWTVIIENLLNRHLHSTNTAAFHNELKKIIRSYQNVKLISEGIIGPLKILARVHGLPAEALAHLLSALEDESSSPQLKVSVAHTLKYCCEKNESYVSATKIIQVVEAVPQSGKPDDVSALEGETSFLQRQLLRELVLTMCIVKKEDDETASQIKKYFCLLEPEDRLNIKGQLEAAGHQLDDTQSADDGGDGYHRDTSGYKFMESFYKPSANRPNVTAFVTKEQQVESMVFQESEKTEMMSFNIQCQAATSLVVVASESAQSSTTALPIDLGRPGEGASDIVDGWFQFTTTNKQKISRLLEKAEKDPASLSARELQFLKEQFYRVLPDYVPNIFYPDEAKNDHDISSIFAKVSKSLLLMDETVKYLVDITYMMLEGFNRDSLEYARYTTEIKQEILRNMLQVVKVQCVSYDQQQFSSIASQLRSFDAYLREMRRDSAVSELQREIWGILQDHVRDDEETSTHIREALNVLKTSADDHHLFEFIMEQVRHGRLDTTRWEKELIPAMLRVTSTAETNEYSTEERRNAVDVIHLHASRCERLNLTSNQFVGLFESLVSLSEHSRIPYYIIRCIESCSSDLPLESLWKAVTDCFKASGATTTRDKVNLLVSFEELVEKTGVNTWWYLRQSYFKTEEMRTVGKMLEIPGVICTDGELHQDLPDDFDPSCGELNGKPCSSVSSIAAKLVADLTNKEDNYDPQVDAMVSQALHNGDKMTRIYCSEYFYKVTTQLKKSLAWPILDVLQSCTDDPVIDVRCYSSVAYSVALAMVHQIPPYHFYQLPLVYCYHPLRLEDEDFTDTVNKSVLKILRKASRDPSMPFNEEIYETLNFALDKMLQESSDDTTKILIILSTVENSVESYPEGRLPPAVVAIVQKIFLQLDGRRSNDDSCGMLLKVLKRGNWLPIPVLQKCSTCLFHTGYVPTAKCLYYAAMLQDIPLGAFECLHMELIGLRLAGEMLLPPEEGVLETIRCLHAYLEKGKLLSDLNMKSLKPFCTQQLPDSTEAISGAESETRTVCCQYRGNTRTYFNSRRQTKKGSEADGKESIDRMLFNVVVDCFTSASSNGQRIPSEELEACLTISNSSDQQKQLKLAAVVIRRNQALPEAFLTAVIEQFQALKSLSSISPVGRQLLELVGTMIELNYWIPEKSDFFKVTDKFGRLAIAMLRTKCNNGLLPINLVMPVLACLMERKVGEGRVLGWKKQLLSIVEERPELIDTILDPILKLPPNYVEPSEVNVLILKALSPHASAHSRSAVCAFVKGNGFKSELLSVLEFFTNSECTDDDKFLSGVENYLLQGVELKLNEAISKQIENKMTESAEFVRWLAEVIHASPLLSPSVQKQHKHLSPLADAAYMAQMNATCTTTVEACEQLLLILKNLGALPTYATQNVRNDNVIVHDIPTAGNAVSNSVRSSGSIEDDFTWETISAYISYLQVPAELMKKVSLNLPRLSSRFTPNQITAIIKTTFEHSKRNTVTLEMIKLWTHFLTYEHSGEVRRTSYVALATTKESADCEFGIPANLSQQIHTNKLSRIYHEVFGDGAPKILRRERETFTQELMETLYFLDSWSLEPLKKIPKPSWIRHLITSDLIDRFATTESERVKLYLAIQSFLKADLERRNLKEEQMENQLINLAEFLTNRANQLHDFGLTVPKAIELLTVYRQTTEAPVSELQLKSLITFALERKLEERFKTPPTGNVASVLVEWLLKTTDNNFGTAERVISAVRIIESAKIFIESLKVLTDFEGMEEERTVKEACFRFLQYCKPVENALELKVELYTTSLLALIPNIQTSPQNENVRRHLMELFQRDYEVQAVRKFLKSIAASAQPVTKKHLQIDNVLNQLCQYNVDSQTFASNIDQLSAGRCIEKTNQLIQAQLHGLWSQERVRNSEQLVLELTQRNSYFEFNFDVERLLRQVVESRHNSRCLPNGKKSILEWAQGVKRGWRRMDRIETVTMLKAAFKLHRDWLNLTPVQVLSILIALHRSPQRIQLQQVSTGSGKSAIIAAVAVVSALQGHKVDIYTSSPVLAQRDAAEWSKFYELFGLTCAHNIEVGSYVRGLKKCYTKDIVYGDMSQFQFDALREEYNGLGTRGKRPYGCALVDEVDSMCIDDSSKLARLSSTLPGMDLLHIVYHFIWNHLALLHSQLVLKDGQIYACGNVVEDIESYMKEQLKEYVITKICQNDGPLKLPKHLKRYAESQASNWSESAITALMFRENEHYVIDGGLIKPVDFNTTGVVQASTNWNNGLHPFLQIKHSLRVTPETVTTNFMSNKAILAKYNHNIVGFTGTLGSEESKAVLLEAYNAESIIVPDMYFKRFHRLRDIVVETKETWMKEIIYSAQHEALKDRGVLIICQTIKEANDIARALVRANSSIEYTVKLYVRNDRCQEAQVERVHPRDIIVATNLGTRGMDIKAVDIKDFGGLHVILSYLPQSLRVEEQAFGRTSRQGDRGTGQLIIISDASHSNGQITLIRDEAEAAGLLHFVQTELPLIQLKDELFTKFCCCFTNIRNSLKDKSIVSTFSTSVRKLIRLDSLSIFDQIVLDAVEERWAMFLKRIDDTRMEQEIFEQYAEGIQREYEDLQSVIRRCYRRVDVIFEATENPFYYIRFGNELYKRNWMLEDNAGKASEYFSKATLEDNPPGFAFVGKAATLLLTGDQSDDNLDSATKSLLQASNLILSELQLYRSCQVLMLTRPGARRTDLYEQLEQKIALLQEGLKIVSRNLNNVNLSIRHVQCTSRGEFEHRSVRIPPGDFVNLLNFNAQSYELTFYGLTCYQDIKVIDQAINTIRTAFKEAAPSNVSIILDLPSNKIANFKAEELTSLAEQTSIALVSQVSSREFLALALECALADDISLQLAGTGSLMQELLHLSVFQGRSIRISYTENFFGNQTEVVKLVTAASDECESILNSRHDESLRVSMDIEPADTEASSVVFRIPGVIVSVEIKRIEPSRLTEATWTRLKELSNEISVSFCTSNQSTAESLVQLLRKQNCGFALKFEGLLSRNQAQYLRSHADRKKEKILQNKLDLMSKRLLDPNLFPMILRGYELLPDFCERNFIPWKSMVVMGTISASQCALGVALISTGIGAKAGMALTTEGVADMLFATTKGRNFTWSEYGCHKVRSVATSVATLGTSGLTNGVKGFKALIQGGANEVVEQVETLALRKGGAFLSELSAMSLKTAASTATNIIVRQQVDQAFKVVSTFSFDLVEDRLMQRVAAEVRKVVDETKMKDDVAAFFTSEAMRHSNCQQKKLSKWLKSLPKSMADWAPKLQATANLLCEKVLQLYTSDVTTANYVSYFKIVSTAIVAVAGIYEILQVTQRVCEYLHACIKLENAQSGSPRSILMLKLNLPRQQLDRVAEIMDIDVNFGVNPRLETTADFDLYDKVLRVSTEYQAIKDKFRGETDEYDRFVQQVTEFVVPAIIKTANYNFWAPKKQKQLINELQRQALSFFLEFTRMNGSNDSTTHGNDDEMDEPDSTEFNGPATGATAPPQSSSDGSGDTMQETTSNVTEPPVTEEVTASEADERYPEIEEYHQALLWVRNRKPIRAMEFLRRN